MTLYEKTIALSKPYLGPATESFLERQCRSHLKIDPSQLIAAQLAELAKWVGVGACLLMEQDKATELAAKVARLH